MPLYRTNMVEQVESLYKIPYLGELIKPHLFAEESRIISTNYSRLNNPGDNGSTLLKIEIKFINSTTGEDWVLSLVAKTPPETIENKNLIHIQTGFKNEVGIYMFAKPALEIFLREKGIKSDANFFGTTFGGRLNLQGEEIVDHNAVIILQNYDILGFKTMPRRTGFDLESSMLVLKTLAKFHGAFLGLKTFKPIEFCKKVTSFLANANMLENIENISRAHMVQVLMENQFCPEIIDRAIATFNRKSAQEAREPWATFVHNNTSVNNIMIRFDRHGRPEHIKLLDFAKGEHNSPLRDLLFFLFTSVELEVLQAHLDDLLDCYYYCFINTLKRLNIENKALFCRLEFNRQLKLAASKSEFYKILCMLYPILALKPSYININYEGNDIPKLQDDLHKKRLYYIINEFDKRAWLHI